MTVFTVDPRQKKIVDLYGRPIGLPINDFGSRTEIEFSGFTYSSSLSIALYLIRPDFRDGQTMPVYYGTAWTESNRVYKHEMKYGKDYYNSVTQNDSLARLVLVADSVVVLDQEVQIDMIHSYSEDAERLPVGPNGYATEAYVDAAVSGKVDESELENYQKLITNEAKLDYSLVSGAPSINDSTITLTQGGATKGSFTLNQASGATIELDAGGGGATSSAVTPSAYQEIQINTMMSSDYATSSNIYNTSVKWFTENIQITPGEYSFDVDLIQDITSSQEVSFSPKDTVVVDGKFLGNSSRINNNNTYEKHIFTLYVNDVPVRQGTFYASGRNPIYAYGYYVSLDPISNADVSIKNGDVVRLHIKFALKASSTYTMYAPNYYIQYPKLYVGAYPIDLKKASNYNTNIYEAIESNLQNVYRLNTSWTDSSGDDVSVYMYDNSFYVNYPSSEIGDNFTLSMYDNTCFVFKTSSSFITYSVSFEGDPYFINSAIDLAASKCYIISYFKGVVLWSELQEYSSN